MRSGIQTFEAKSLYSCIKNVIKIRKKNETSSQTIEQVDNPPLRYVTVMTHLRIVFVLFVPLKR